MRVAKFVAEAAIGLSPMLIILGIAITNLVRQMVG